MHLAVQCYDSHLITQYVVHHLLVRNRHWQTLDFQRLISTRIAKTLDSSLQAGLWTIAMRR